MAKEEPKRSCLGCRSVKNRNELLRFVLAPEGIPVPDLLSRLPGRGAYTCPDKECLKNAVARNQFKRAFKSDVGLISAEELIAVVVAKMEERIASYLSLANKAGRIVSGSDMVMQVLKKNRKDMVILISTDISADIQKKVVSIAEKVGVEYFSILDKDRIGALIGKGLRSVVAVEGHGFVSAIKRELERYRNFVGEVCS